eukprot:TRINITY_DN3794_c0_g1_i1.p1 TRINITY_DN3794_c0_g1~~TRINITY_DN3794_c0_g1_i1.p1  ORF type:complete len:414 (-),score=41.47 TRINITY_DN3794_c0_g1_i1:64-1131(-)
MANAVTGKIVTVPMYQFGFFIGIFNSGVYTVVYSLILLIRVWVGITPYPYISWIWKPQTKGDNAFARLRPIYYLIMIGFLDGLGQILDLTSRPHLSGPLVSLLPQSGLVFSVLVSYGILRDKYSYWQLWCVLVVLFGVVLTVIPSFQGASSTDASQIKFMFLAAMQPLPSAFSTLLKDYMFRKKEGLDPFIVNSHNSFFQFLLQPPLAAISIALNPAQLKGQEIWPYFKSGFDCWAGITPEWVRPVDCSPQPWTYLAYIFFNLLLNISYLYFLKEASIVIAYLVNRLILPLSVISFFIPWPLIGATTFSPWSIGGLVVILFGTILFRYLAYYQKQEKLGCCTLHFPTEGLRCSSQ